MNPCLNPITALPFLKNYLFDPGRLKRQSPKQIKKYRDKAFRKLVNYAYTVPVYHKKYKKAGVHPRDIKTIDDISKLPFITKKDIMDSYSEGIIPKEYDETNSSIVSTSGSTGKPISFYVDFVTLSKAICLFARQGITYGYNWRKINIVSLGNFSQGKSDQVFDEHFVSHTNAFRNSDKYLKLNAFYDIKVIVEKLNDFKPDYIVSYPVTFQQLAYFKKNGYADNINPIILLSSGYVLDEYTRSYVEDAFKCRLLNTYTAAESMADIAFECYNNIWHLNYDYFHIEAVDAEMNIVPNGEKGHVVMTRLFGKGTPLIRYTGLDDWVTISPEYECDCGLCTPILKNGVEGRQSTSVVLPNGKVIPAASFAIVSLILKDLKTFKVTQFQIIQDKIDKIDILLVIDDELRDEPPSIDVMFKRIKEVYEDKFGSDIEFKVKEVKKIDSPKGKPLPLVVSKVKPEEGFKKTEKISFKNWNKKYK